SCSTNSSKAKMSVMTGFLREQAQGTTKEQGTTLLILLVTTLPTVNGKITCSVLVPLVLVPPINLFHNACNGIGVRRLHGGGIPSKAFTPNFHIANNRTFYRANPRFPTKFTTVD